MSSTEVSTAAATRTLSEAASKALIAEAGIRVVPERIVATADEAVAAADGLGYPAVAKLCGDGIAHKTERGLVRLALADASAVHRAAMELLDAATPEDGDVDVLVAPMVHGTRELIAGLARDAQFGPTVMLGVGGILAEAIGDAVVRLVPIEPADAHEMIDELATQALLDAFRGEPPVDRDALAEVLVALSAVIDSKSEIVSVDVNPLIVVDGEPVAVDALVEVTTP